MSMSHIEVIHHPHSGNMTSAIIPIDISSEDHPTTSRNSMRRKFNNYNEAKPWAPFRKRADFEFARTAVTKAFDRETVETLIEGFRGRWASKTEITFHNFADYQKSLEAARNFGIRFQSGEVAHMFKGKLRVFKFEYRDPWQWLLDIVTDPMLSESIMWYPVEKYLHHNGRICRIYDELNTGSRWWNIQDSLPQEEGMPHCFLPLHLWLNKSNVAKTVKKHPIILRPGFLPSVIRNASGNGGGMLTGYMSIVGDPNETTETEDDSASSVELAEFKREIYHKIHNVIFRSIRRRSRSGEAVRCGDKITRILHPGFLIHAVDGEEAYCLCGTRGVRANYPCPRCLVYKSLLDKLSIPLIMRTQDNMQDIYNKALILKRSAAEKTLKDAGLHLVKNAFWRIHNSDPYLAYSYDMLHAFDSGEWGKHQWPLLRDHILDPSQKKHLASNMRLMPRWRSLRHFNAVTSIEFGDGNSYRDILKCIIPALTDILPHNSPVIHCFRLLAILRAIAGLRPISEEHIVYFEKSLPKYETLCTRLAMDYNKNYNYPKHHFLMHLPFDLRSKASTDNYTTRPGEGFQQEVQQAYEQTNFRDTERQMIKIDENQEAIARITMAVEHYDASKYVQSQEEDENDGEEAPPPVIEEAHWKLGSPLRRISARDWEISEAGNPAFRRFESKLTNFLTEILVEDDRPSQPLLLHPYQCIYLHYRSLENWQEIRDILRCNPNFYSNPRYDCVIINTQPISFARLYALFSCQGPSKIKHYIALIGKFRATKWKPKTVWDGCRVFEEKEYDFVLLKYLIRGCHMIPAFEKSGKMFYLNDLVDGDAFIRFFLGERLSQSDL
ncbi:hypothetical protein M422DRAFT_180706 [Sphaerobolus stellatus SS14]|uniref:Uncharacterized protein n=1 Tax=Sphaerobolus stellatus (strain SS14) TaxID=990650 RepID=A0A0C9V1E4_SPHS4|nr:hypothetical protein M422DRAFT_180706 [Sphaerobolus stellatus SS14]